MKEMHFELKSKTSIELQQESLKNFNVKIVDMGNACYIDHHFHDFISTRYYRAPEVIMGGTYDEKADIWSFACMIFEMVTSDILFRPKAKDKNGSKEEDHILLIQSYIGDCNDKEFLLTCNKAGKHFKLQGDKLTLVGKKKPKKCLKNVFFDKYHMKEPESEYLAKMLLRCLTWNPKDRISAKDLLNDPWFKMPQDYNVIVQPQYYFETMMIRDPTFIPMEKKGKHKSESYESDVNPAWEEDK